MSNELVKHLAKGENKKAAGMPSVSGVVAAVVVNNVDVLSQGRVQIALPWAGLQPWARVAVPMAGTFRGTYFMPQVGDEVLVAFSRGDVREPFVVGCLWNGTDRPPILAPTDAVTKRVVRTVVGHEMTFDDATQAITITSSTQQSVTVDATGVELSAVGGATKVKVGVDGSVSITAAREVSIQAPSVSINGARVSVEATASASVSGGTHCAIKAGLVEIN